MAHTGLTLKAYRAQRFYYALDAYQEALASKDSARIVAASLAVYIARRNDADRRMINRVFKAVSA
jgi:hypothetical protein